jgi:DNA-binding response OmpR family regulator
VAARELVDRMTILLIDSAEGDAAVLSSALRVEGFDVVVARGATEAHAALTAQPIAITILDLMVRTDAGHSGLELARGLRRAYPGMRILLTSSYHLSERQLERADCGVSGFIPKPYDVREVVEFVRAKASSPPSSRRLWCAEHGSGVNYTTTPDPGPASSLRRSVPVEALAVNETDRANEPR